MFGLWMFGKILENVWGPKRFLLFYLICGVGAAIFHLAIQDLRFEQAEQLYNSGSVDEGLRLLSSIGPALGASGAIMGIFAAFGYLFPNTPLYMMFIPIPIKAKWAMIGMAAIDLFGGVANFSGDNVAHFAHLGGAVTGFIIVLIWNKTNRNRFY
jgi:membrane associated rhomboid family serine protease